VKAVCLALLLAAAHPKEFWKTLAARRSRWIPTPSGR